MEHEKLEVISYQSLLELATEEGINASGKEEIFGCIFGRDSAITILKILKALSNKSIPPSIETAKLLDISKRGLLTLTDLQGQEVNIESGEEPGKFLHEYRKENLDRFLDGPKPWYIYPDGTLKNYDSIDSTPLNLLAIYKYWQFTKDQEFLLKVLPAVEKGLNWITDYGDRDQDYLLEYEFDKKRTHGGLFIQSWADSIHTLKMSDGTFPPYPIAPVEVQGYAWLALKQWVDYFSSSNSDRKVFAKRLNDHANSLKKRFNETFVFKDEEYDFPAQALDGNKKQLKTVTSNPLLLLWASHVKDGRVESILGDEYIDSLVDRSFQKDLFDPDAGIRTMSVKSPWFNPGQDSYQNGSFWPKINGMAHEGLMHWGFVSQAAELKEAALKPIYHFRTPIELHIKGGDGQYLEYRSPDGQVSCKKQAWSAAVILDLATL
ncbi:hypothetical protein M1349_02145 [Patescibacteria group bacterium]|nr:hypothetical protein [Patescibacteria group bacterium]